MKKLYKFIAFYFCLTLMMFSYFGFSTKQTINYFSYAKAESTTYAKASAGCVLYKSDDLNNNINNIYFVIPETYFVSVLEVVSDACMRVQYGTYVGYVSTDTLVVATFIPIVKTLDNIKFDIKETSGTQIWSTPSSNNKVLTTIPAGTKNVNYISFAYGDIPSGGESNIWYYVSYTPKSNSTNVYEGYVYSENVTNLSEIVANTESNPETILPNDGDDNILTISSSVRTLLIALISIPVILLFAIILYKIVKNVRNFRSNRHDFAENEISGEFATENEATQIEQKYSLKDRINNLKNSTLVRKNRSSKYSDNSTYPIFPSYDSDDDLL